MFLRRVEVENFRAYTDASFDLPSIGLTLVVGPNNSGKTAVLSAIDVLAGIKPGAGAARSGVGDRLSVVRGRFVLSEDEREALLSLDDGTATAWRGTDGLTEIELQFRDFNADRMWLEEIRISGSDGTMMPVAINHFNMASGNFEATSVVVTDLVKAGPGAPAELGDPHSGNMPDYLPSQVQLYPLPDLIQTWRGHVYHFEALRIGAGRMTPSHGVPRLAPTGSDLPQALLNIMSADEPDWHRIVRVMQDVVPDVGTLAAPVQGTEVAIAFRDPHLDTLHNLKDLGTGVEQLLMTVYVGVRQPPGSLVIVEEPETNLHPAAQRALMRYLAEWARDRSFILATHSTVFLDDRSGARKVLLVEREGGRSTIREATAGLEDVLDAIGVKLSDVLSADKIVLLEGDTDTSVMRAWFPELALSRGVAVAPMHGGDRANHVDMVAAILDEADQLNRQVLVIRDRDELTDSVAWNLEKTGLVYVLQRRELENYLLDVPAIRTVLERQAQDLGADRQPTLEAAKLETLLRQTADALKQTVILKRVAAELGVVRLMPRAEVQRLAKDSPTAEGLGELIRSGAEQAADLAERVPALWAAQEKALDEIWDDRWREMAPGEELLQAVWSAHGGRFEKGRDGPQIAIEMSDPPEELAEVLRGFIAEHATA